METPQKRRVLSILAVGGVAGAALATGVVGGSGGLGIPDEAAASALEPFDSCDELLEYAQEHRWAYNAYPYAMEGDVAFLSSAGAAEDSAFRAAIPNADSLGAIGPGETGTNTQEDGIDEPDIAKLSGTTLFRVQGKALRSYDVSGDSAELLDEIELEGGIEHAASDCGRQGAGHLGRLRQQARHPNRVRCRSRHLGPRRHVGASQLGARRRERERPAPGLHGASRRPVPAPVPRTGQGLAAARAASDGGRRRSHGRDRRDRP